MRDVILVHPKSDLFLKHLSHFFVLLDEESRPWSWCFAHRGENPRPDLGDSHDTLVVMEYCGVLENECDDESGIALMIDELEQLEDFWGLPDVCVLPMFLEHNPDLEHFMIEYCGYDPLLSNLEEYGYLVPGETIRDFNQRLDLRWPANIVDELQRCVNYRFVDMSDHNVPENGILVLPRDVMQYMAKHFLPRRAVQLARSTCKQWYVHIPPPNPTKPVAPHLIRCANPTQFWHTLGVVRKLRSGQEIRFYQTLLFNAIKAMMPPRVTDVWSVERFFQRWGTEPCQYYVGGDGRFWIVVDAYHRFSMPERWMRLLQTLTPFFTSLDARIIFFPERMSMTHPDVPGAEFHRGVLSIIRIDVMQCLRAWTPYERLPRDREFEFAHLLSDL